MTKAEFINRAVAAKKAFEAAVHPRDPYTVGAAAFFDCRECEVTPTMRAFVKRMVLV